MKKKKVVEAQIVMLLGFFLLSFILGNEWLLYFAAGLGVIFITSKVLGLLIVKGWFKLAEGLGWINSRILLSVIFFFILTPVSLLRKLTSKKDSLILKKKGRTTMFTERNHTYTPEDLEKMW